MLTRAALLLLVPALLCAQPPMRPRPWWDSEVSRELNLSDAQIKQIRQTQKEFRPRMRELMDEVNKSEAALDALFNEETVDQAKANEEINHLAAARAEVTKAVSQLDLKLRMILTAQQWKDLKEKEGRPWPGRGQGGPRRGGPRGGTGPPNPANQQK